MIENVIARRYAVALAEVAAEQNELERVNEEVKRLADILNPEGGEVNVPELLDFLGSPIVPLDEKIQMTDVLCEKLQIGKLVSEFLNVLIKRGRVPLASKIADEYIHIAARIENIYAADVESAEPLSEVDEKRLRESLEKATGERIRLSIKQNKKLLGGVRVKVGDQLFDGSILGRLDRLEAELV